MVERSSCEVEVNVEVFGGKSRGPKGFIYGRSFAAFADGVSSDFDEIHSIAQR
jgi:hypothetical protein